VVEEALLVRFESGTGSGLGVAVVGVAIAAGDIGGL
jgi:hypothetical protein